MISGITAVSGHAQLPGAAAEREHVPSCVLHLDAIHRTKHVRVGRPQLEESTRAPRTALVRERDVLLVDFAWCTERGSRGEHAGACGGGGGAGHQLRRHVPRLRHTSHARCLCIERPRVSAHDCADVPLCARCQRAVDLLPFERIRGQAGNGKRTHQAPSAQRLGRSPHRACECRQAAQVRAPQRTLPADWHCELSARHALS
mmetsp:Transcript_15590/g.40407  ORF Transcript_15590/g.40407 Transcript_15590/m.40407 type:complete len:202 (+) Transcript_15590:193-798(+)